MIILVAADSKDRYGIFTIHDRIIAHLFYLMSQIRTVPDPARRVISVAQCTFCIWKYVCDLAFSPLSQVKRSGG